MRRIFRHRVFRTALSGLFASWLAACASMPPVSYSLEDSEIYVATRPHFLTVAVATMDDRRSPEEKAWASRFGLPSGMAGVVSDRIVRHLRVSSVFSQVQSVSGPVDSNSPGRIRDLLTQGVDALLVGEMIHFYGRNDPDRRIEGHVQFDNLKLYSTHTGQLLWQGTADKLIQRQEKNPGRDNFYADEALRGAINQLAIQLSGLSFSRGQVYSSERTAIRHWRVGVLLPQDLRPSEEKNPAVRKFQGNTNYSLFSDDFSIEGNRFSNDLAVRVSEQWVKKLEMMEVFGEVRTIKSRGFTSEELQEWAEEDVDAILVSELNRFSASVTPVYNSQSFPIWSGGMGYRPLFKATAFTRIEEVKLIETRDGKVIWKGEAECGLDRTVKRWESPDILLEECLNKTLDRLVDKLTRVPPVSDDKSSG